VQIKVCQLKVIRQNTRLEPTTNEERKDGDDRGETSTSDVEAQVGKVGVRVVFLDLIDDKVTRRAIRDVAVQSLGHARMQQGDDFAFGIKDDGPRVAEVSEVATLFVIVEDGGLPGVVLEFVAMVRFQLRVATKGKIGRLPVLGHYEGRATLVVHEVGVRHARSVDAAQKWEEMVFRVVKDRWVGSIGVEKRIDLCAGVLAS
jgi:hypothetical protein